MLSWMALLTLATGAQAKDLLYFVDVCRFYNTTGEPYIEVYLNIDAQSAFYHQAEDSTFSANIEVLYEIHKKEDLTGEPIFSRPIELGSGAVMDTTPAHLSFGFMDAKRILLDPGSYVLTGTLKDKADPSRRVNKFEREILIQAQPTLASISDVEFIQYFKKATTESPISKLGYEIMPLISNASFMDADTLKYYVELYNLDKESEKIVHVHTYLTEANSVEKLDLLQETVKKSARPMGIHTGSFDISGLASQTYYLNIEIYNHANKVIASRSEKIFVFNSRVENVANLEPVEMEGDFSQHFNMTEEDLNYYLPTLQYISTPTERDFVTTLKTLEEKQNYFYNFWLNRREDRSKPIAAEWRNYRERVKYANEHYKSVYQDGWRTARGRVLLTYGPPNDFEQHFYENDSYPYEIWRYNRLGVQSGVMFVFYDPDRATEDWPLLHSDKLGERNNPRWRLDLIARSVHEGNLDRNNPGGFMTPGRQ